MTQKSSAGKVVIGGFIGIVTLLLLFVTLFVSIDEDKECGTDAALPATSISIDNKGKEENAKAIYSYVKEHIPDATPQGICGMLGNFEQESQLNPTSIERKNDPRSGHGIAQWTADRTDNLKNFASQKGKEWSDLGIQLEYLIQELNGAEKNGVSALKVSDVEQATADWQTKFERAGIPEMANRLTYANGWYAKLGASDPVGSASLSTAVDGEKKETNIACSSTNTGKADGDIVKAARKYVGWFHYPDPIAHNLAMIGGDAKNPDKEGRTDCSGFVWLALENAGYKVPPDMGWFTGTMASDARGTHQWFNEVAESEADAGDVVIVNVGGGSGSSGHTAIIAEKWHGNDTKIIQMGGNGSITNEDTFRNSFLSLLGSGDVCFARAIKK